MANLKIVNPRGQTVLSEHEEGESISSLITRCNEAMGKMSNSNPHKILIHDCALALRQLCDQMWKMEHPNEPEEQTPIQKIQTSGSTN